MINTKASAVRAPTPGWVISRSTSGRLPRRRWLARDGAGQAEALRPERSGGAACAGFEALRSEWQKYVCMNTISTISK
jgi:hypothetical protein